MYAFCIFGLVYKQSTKREKTKAGRIYLKMKYERKEILFKIKKHFPLKRDIPE